LLAPIPRGGVPQVPDLRGLGIEMLAPVGHRATRPQRPDDLSLGVQGGAGAGPLIIRGRAPHPGLADRVSIGAAAARGSRGVASRLLGGRIVLKSRSLSALTGAAPWSGRGLCHLTH
jgi:hypothetical protein